MQKFGQFVCQFRLASNLHQVQLLYLVLSVSVGKHFQMTSRLLTLCPSNWPQITWAKVIMFLIYFLFVTAVVCLLFVFVFPSYSVFIFVSCYYNLQQLNSFLKWGENPLCFHTKQTELINRYDKLIIYPLLYWDWSISCILSQKQYVYHLSDRAAK